MPTSASRLLEDALRIPFRGWDFTALGDRIVLEPPGWSFEEIVDGAAADAASMLDMGTGGGEWLGSRRRAARTIATESWPPNVPIAAARLRSLGVALVQDEGAIGNIHQKPVNARGRLAFRDGAFDLVVSRHEAFVATEVHRVLGSAGVFLSQQASAGSRQFHQLLGLQPPAVEEFHVDLAAAQLTTAGFSVACAEAGTAVTVFADIGALAWYLANVPWAVPGFSLKRHRDALVKLHGHPIRVASDRFWIRAHRQPR